MWRTNYVPSGLYSMRPDVRDRQCQRLQKRYDMPMTQRSKCSDGEVKVDIQGMTDGQCGSGGGTGSRGEQIALAR